MRTLVPGETDRRTGAPVQAAALPWTRHPNNPMRQA